MKILYKHLVNRINNEPKICELSEKLFQLGHEHEIEDHIFDMEFTPNRGDCLSLKGLLRDLNLFYETNPVMEVYEKDINNFKFKFTNNANEACFKISFLKIEIQSIPEKYNDNLESYFSDLEIKKNNFFTDVSNYISYETGQPTHCYEAEKIEAGLKLDFSKDKQLFKTLLGKNISVEADNLVFFNDKDEIVNLAGIVGGASTSCNRNTKSVIVECAYFNPEEILGKAVKYSINSDAAYKFERNVDPNSHEYVLRRFIKIVEEHAKIVNVEFCTNKYNSVADKIITLDVNKINSILGTNIKEKDCIEYLESFGFIINEMLIYVPSHRHDIKNINDIAEEIARSIGYNNIKPKKFVIASKKTKHTRNDNEIKIKNLLISNGFYEVINDPFTYEQYEDSIEVDNPLDSNRKFLRTSLKNSLIESLLYNERRQHDSIKLFEISDLYSIKSKSAKRFIGIIVSGRVDKNYVDFTKKLDVKFLEDLLENHLDKKINLNYEVISRDSIKSKSARTIAYVEIELNKILKVNHKDILEKNNGLDIKYIPISDYPSSSRDLSFSIKDFSKYEQLQQYIFSINDDILKEVFVFDYFFNKKNEEIKIGFRFVFQSKISTITDEDVNNIIDSIINYTESVEGINIPGLE